MAGKRKTHPVQETECGTERTTGLTGLEPATYGVTGRHSNRLSYNPQVLQKNESPFLVGDDGLEPPTCCV